MTAPASNINLAPDVSVDDLCGKPFTLICEVVAGEDGRPVLRSLHPCEISKLKLRGDKPAYRLSRLPFGLRERGRETEPSKQAAGAEGRR